LAGGSNKRGARWKRALEPLCQSCVASSIKMIRQTMSGRPPPPPKRPSVERTQVNGLNQSVAPRRLPRLRRMRKSSKPRGKRKAVIQSTDDDGFPENLAPAKQKMIKRGKIRVNSAKGRPKSRSPVAAQAKKGWRRSRQEEEEEASLSMEAERLRNMDSCPCSLSASGNKNFLKKNRDTVGNTFLIKNHIYKNLYS